MTSSPFSRLALALVVLTGGPAAAGAQTAWVTTPVSGAEAYTWRNIAIGGGGFVPGLVFHPREPDLLYARTDVGGAYRWDRSARRWEPLLDWVGRDDWNLHGIESLALDPTDPDRLYLAAGTYTFPDAPLGEILSSRNRGRTWERTLLPFKFGGNEAGRGSGERLQVDPAEPNRLYLGTRRDGLWWSHDHGASWSRLESFPDIPDDSRHHPWSPGEPFNYLSQPVGVVWVRLIPNPDGTEGPTRTLYAAVSTAETSLFRSHDAGRSWEAVPGQPLGRRPTDAAWGHDDRLWVTYGDEPGPNAMRRGSVWTLDLARDKWVEVTPEPATPKNHSGYAAVAVDPQDPSIAVVTTWMRAPRDEIFRTTDGGKTWRGLFTEAQWDHSSAPYTATLRPHWMSDVEIDPLDRRRILFTTGYGIWKTEDALAFDAGRPVRWTFFNENLEETVPLVLVSPPVGPHLISGLGDVDGFVHHDFDVSPPEGRFRGPRLKDTSWMDYAGEAPHILVRSGVTYQHDRIHAAFTKDSGASWQELATEPPHVRADPKRHPVGPVGISADGGTISWTLNDQIPYLTDDYGQTWRPAGGAPIGLWAFGDRVEADVFYGYDAKAGSFYVSRDRGRTFAETQQGLPTIPYRDWAPQLAEAEAVPGHAGEVWLVVGEQLWHFQDFGRRVRALAALSKVGSVGLGAPPPGGDYPTVFIVATIDGSDGIYRSDTRGETWVRLTDDQHRYGQARALSGDSRVFGRLYFATGGRGIVAGEPATSVLKH
jgi:hypothetical protein